VSADRIVDEASLSNVYTEKTAAATAAQRAGLIDDRISAADLVFLLLSLSSYWSAAPHIPRMLASGDYSATTADKRHAARSPCRNSARRRLNRRRRRPQGRL
jgi:Tetracyclin repressor-like, C-terminal domain